MIAEHGIDEYKPYQCKYCNSKLRKNYDLIQHYERNHTDIENRPKFICDECGKELFLKSSLNRHITRVHKQKRNGKKIVEFQDQETCEKNFICSQCGVRFMNNRNLQRHYKLHAREKSEMKTIVKVS